MADATLAIYDTPEAEAAFRKAEQALGGRQAIVQALLAAPPNESLDYVVGLIANPASDARSLASICRDGAITIGELLEAFKRGVLATAVAEAIAHVAEKTPEIVREVVKGALPKQVACDRCAGTGTTPQSSPPTACPFCENGWKTIDGNFAQQQFVLTTLAQMAPVKAPLIQIDARDQSDRRSLRLDTSGQTHAKLLAAADRILAAPLTRPRAETLDLPRPAAYTADEPKDVDARPDREDAGHAPA